MQGSSTGGVIATLLRWTVRLLLLAFALLVVGAITVVVVLPRATHGSALTVLTGSMTPGIPVGSVVIVRPVDPGTLKVGDIATYQVAPGKAEYITHRIVRINAKKSPEVFRFKGDANRGPDINPVPAGAIRGQVWFHVPYLGAIRDGLHGKGGISLVAMLLLGGYAASQLGGAYKERKTTSTKPGGTPLVLERTLILVSLRPHTVEAELGPTPEEAARRCGALLVDADEEAVTLLIAPGPDSAAAAVEILLQLDPLSVEVVGAPCVVSGGKPSEEILALLRGERRERKPAGHALI